MEANARVLGQNSISLSGSAVLGLFALCLVAGLTSGCAKGLGSDQSEPNKNAPLSQDAMKKVSGLSDTELVSRARSGKLGHCLAEDVTAKKATCATGASYAVFITGENLYYPSESLEPETSSICAEDLATNLRQALTSGICFAKQKPVSN